MLTKQPNSAHAAAVATRFANLKTRLLLERLNETPEPETHAEIIKQESEAALLAWVSGYPLLVFPCLFEERALAAVTLALRQIHRYWDNFQPLTPSRPVAEDQRERPKAHCQIGIGRKAPPPGSYLMLLRQHRGKPCRCRPASLAFPATA